MKRLLALSAAFILSVPALSTTVVLAAVTKSDVKVFATTNTETTAEAKLPADDPQHMGERIEKRKAEIKTRLNETEKLVVKTKCKAAQGSISSVRGRAKGIETSRTEVFKNLINRLNDLSSKLKNKGSRYRCARC